MFLKTGHGCDTKYRKKILIFFDVTCEKFKFIAGRKYTIFTFKNCELFIGIVLWGRIAPLISITCSGS